MSSTAPTPTFTRPDLQTFANDATGTPASANSGVMTSTGNGGPSTNSSLYLYTFLVTLALLLSISAAILGRSYVLRRRLRALVAAGILPPEALVNTPRRHGGIGQGNGPNVGRRPGMFEVWVREEKAGYGAREIEGGSDGGFEEKAAPLSLAPLAALLAAQQQRAPPPVHSEQSPPRPARRPNFSVPFFSRRDPYAPPRPPVSAPSPRITSAASPHIPSESPTQPSRWRPFTRPSNPPPTSEDTELQATSSRGKQPEEMQLALLVAMPAEQGKDHGAGEIPVLEIGVRVVGARVPEPRAGKQSVSYDGCGRGCGLDL